MKKLLLNLSRALAMNDRELTCFFNALNAMY